MGIYLFFMMNTIRTPAATRRLNNLEWCCLTSTQEKEKERWWTNFWPQFSHQNNFPDSLGRACSTHAKRGSFIARGIGSGLCDSGSFQRSLRLCPDIASQKSQYQREILGLSVHPKGK